MEKEKNFRDMSHEEQAKYLKNLPLCEEGFKATDCDMSDEEWAEFTKDCVPFEEVDKRINQKYGI